jgi:hypothetical protein
VSDGAVELPPEFLRRDVGEERQHVTRAELVLDSLRAVGVIQRSGVSRRLVDILNSTDGPFVVLRDATVQSLASPEEEPRRFEVLQVRRERILLAIPVSTTATPSGGLEVVEKLPTAATLLLPGVEVTGQVYLPPEADPMAVRLLDRRDFLPVTHAEITQTAFGLSWREPLVVVNLGRVTLYAPAPR